MPFEPDAALLTPILTPAVLDDPELLAILLSIAQGDNGMVDDCIFTTTIENTRLIVEPCVGCNRYCYGARFCQCSDQRFILILGKRRPARHAECCTTFSCGRGRRELSQNCFHVCGGTAHGASSIV